ncbi:MAG: phage tail protein [Planctomycetota bacterium]
MATVVLGVAGAAIGGPYAPITAAIGAGIGAYIDNTLVYPALFGKPQGQQRPDSLEGFQVSTTDPGAPRWQVFGTRAWVPCHYLWSLNLTEDIAGNGQSGKGGRPFVSTVRVDAGIAACDGPVTHIDTLYADERPFWSRQWNRVAVEESRWTIASLAGPYLGQTGPFLSIMTMDQDTVDFSGVFSVRDYYSAGIYNAPDLILAEKLTPTGLNGYYKLVGVDAHAANSLSEVVLKPLQGQTPATGTAGTAVEPGIMRRIDQGAYGDPTGSSSLSGLDRWIIATAGVAPNGAYRMTLAIPATIYSPTQRSSVPDRIVVGGVYQMLQFSPDLPGRWRCTGYSVTSSGGGGNQGNWVFEAVDGQTPSGTYTAGSVSAPAIIVRDTSGGYLYFDTVQTWTEYPGIITQAADPTFAAATGDAGPPAHRGIAHLSLSRWNLAAHYNMVPRVTGMIRRVSGDSVGATIRRICERTAPPENVDVSKLRPKPLLGYAVPGGMPGSQALQPIQIMHGAVPQERGGVLTFLDERDLPIVAVATRHLNARPANEDTTTRGFVAKAVDEADIPERVILEYIDPAEGGNEAESDGNRAPLSRNRGGRDTMKLNLRPLVVWPHEVKRRAREMRRRIRMETIGGEMRLPPGYMDVLPAHCLTFAANNNEEELLLATSTIDHYLRLRDVLPFSLRVHVRFANGQVATLADNGNGALDGLPTGITASVNVVTYATGRVQLTTSVAIDTSSDHYVLFAYRYEKQWLVRAHKARLLGYDFGVQCEVVSTTTDQPLPPLPRELPPSITGPIVPGVPAYRVHVLDIPSIYAGQLRAVTIPIVAGPPPGGAWRGAVVYQSPNGTDRWVAVGQIQAPTTVGSLTTNNLPTSSTANLGIVDWKTSLAIELPNGETLDDATTEQIAQGMNWLLVGNEIIAFHEAEAGSGSAWTLRGLVRAMRNTKLAVDTHAAGERVVLLWLLGIHGLIYEPVGGFTAANRTYHLRVVPGGATVDDVSTITTLVRGRSALPAAPTTAQFLLTQKVGSYVQLEWKRTAIDQTTIFGPSYMQAGEFERYEVVAFKMNEAQPLFASLGVDAAISLHATQRWFVGNEAMGTPLVDPVIQYDETTIAAHGYSFDDDPIGFVVYAIGPAGRSDRSDLVQIVPST